MIHVEHPHHDGGVRSFYRHRDSVIAATLRDHLADLEPAPVRVDVTDTVGLGLCERELLPGDDSVSASVGVETV